MQNQDLGKKQEVTFIPQQHCMKDQEWEFWKLYNRGQEEAISLAIQNRSGSHRGSPTSLKVSSMRHRRRKVWVWTNQSVFLVLSSFLALPNKPQHKLFWRLIYQNTKHLQQKPSSCSSILHHHDVQFPFSNNTILSAEKLYKQTVTTCILV